MIEEKKEKCMEQSEEQFNIQEILSMIFRTTVVFPEPVPPAMPIINISLSIYLN